MSGAGDLLGTLGAVAPSALAGYTRGQARGLQFQIQQQRQQQVDPIELLKAQYGGTWFP
jgi:hypothetical protein